MSAPGSEPRLGPELAAFVHGGVAVSIATRDASLRPAFTRGWGRQVSADGRTVGLCVTAPPGSATRSNLEENGAMAIGFSPPTIARALQVKGHGIVLGDPDPAQMERAERHFEAFSAEARTMGYPIEVVRRLYDPGLLLAAALSIDDVFDQTPGPGAGKRL
jgi:hypothetical protein